tara:strand:+ start:556 stop:2943 length:2388 start_codon:yes stop_codon:yes gene_type:complete
MDCGNETDENLGSYCVYYQRGYEYYQSGQFEKAINNFDKAIELNLEHGFSHFALGAIYSKMGDFKEALYNYDEAIEECLQFDADDQAYVARGDCHRDLAQYENAIWDYESAIRLNPKCHQAFIGRGYTYLHEKRYADSIKDFSRAIALKPKDDEGYFNRGYAYSENQKYDEAVKDYSKSIELSSFNKVNSYRNRAIAFNKLGHADKAIADYTAAINIEESELLYHYRCELYLQTSDYDKAIEDSSQVIKLNPSNSKAYSNRAQANLKKQYFLEALSDIDSALSLDSSDLKLYFNRAAIYMELNDYDKAIDDLAAVIKIEPDSSVNYYNRSIAYKLKGDFLMSLLDANKSIALNHKDSRLFDNRAIIYWNMGEYQDAINDYQKSLGINSENPDTYFHLGSLNDQLGNVKSAVEKYTMALNYGYEPLSVYKSRGQGLYELGHFGLALDDFQMVLSSEPGHILSKHYVKKVLAKKQFNPSGGSNLLVAMDCKICDSLEAKTNKWGEPQTCMNCKEEHSYYPAGFHDNQFKCKNCKQTYCCNCVMTLAFCGRTICIPCAEKLNIASDHSQTCPSCKTGLNEKKLVESVIAGDLDRVKECISIGVDVNVKERQCFDQYGRGDLIHKLRTPLYYAVANTHIDILEYLVCSKARVTELFSINPDGTIDLFELAESKEDKQIIKILRGVLAVKTLGQQDFFFIVRKQLLKLAKDLLDNKNIDVNLKDDIGDAPIHYAVCNNDFQMIDLLVNKGVDLYSANKNGASIYRLAQLRGYTDMCQRIKELGFSESAYNAVNLIEKDLS